MAFWLIALAAVALVAVTFLLRPKIKTPKPEAAKDLENPTAEAGRPIPVPFGDITIKGLNSLWYGEKVSETFKIDA